MKALCWADSKRTWSTWFQSNQSVSSTIAKTINRNATTSLENLVFISHLVSWGWVQVDEPCQVWAWTRLIQQIEISQDLNKKSIYSPAHFDLANLMAKTCAEEFGDVESSERLVELQRPADRELWQSYLQLVHLEWGGLSIYVELFDHKYIFMLYVHLEKGALSQSLRSCFFSPCRSRTWSRPSHQTLSRGWDAWRSPVFVILRALLKQFINEKCTHSTALVYQSF